jgi:class 3 adenylate cyclase/tetratricopeptide (TPR) repeat protein
MLPDHRGPLDPDGPPVGRCAACGAALPATARFCASCGRSVEVPSSDERRPVTILFVDIVGSTSLAERLDAEDWKAVVDPALARFTAVVEGHGGRVAQLLGDGLLAFFGAPVAHEDDAIRAVQAGLGLVEATRQLGSRTVGSQEAHLEIRVGISSGEVVVGAVGGEGRREYLAVGDAVNVAARLQAAAPPMGVLVSDETFRLVAAAVEGRTAGPLPLKGKADAVVAHEIVALRSVVGHGRRVREGGPLVGREEELSRLAPLRERLEASTGAVVSIVGEPGLGKTRLVREWHRSLEDPGLPPHPVRWVEAGCLTTGRDLPYHLARECLRGLLEVADEPDPATVRRAAETAAARLTELDDAAPLLARLLDLPAAPEDEAALAGLDGRAIQRRLSRALRGLIESMASDNSLILVAEDVHWIDPSSAELLAEVLHIVPAQPVVVCLTMRSEKASGVDQLEREIDALPAGARLELRLRPLVAQAQRSLAADLLGADDLPEAVRSMMLERCDGNPLFVEQLVGTLLDRGLLRRTEGGWWVDPRAADAVPPSLQGLLLARLDTMPHPVHRLATISSVIGREAPLGLLRAVAIEAGEPEAAAALGGAIDAGGLLERVGPDGEILAFRHALVHDAAYSTLVRADRRRIHRIVGLRLEREAEQTGRLSEAAAVLAHHFGRAEDHEPTMRYARMAAERAAASYANAEALALYETAVIAARSTVAASPDDAGEDARIDVARLLEARAEILELVGRIDETYDAYAEALANVPPGRRAWRARLEALLGSVAGGRGRRAEQQQHLLAAEAILGDPPSDADPEWWLTWIDIRDFRASRAYWLGETEEMEALIASLEEPVRLYGTARQRAEHHDTIASFLQRRDKYLPSQEVLDHKLAAAAATAELGDRRAMAWERFTLGFTYAWNLDFAAAERELGTALAEAEQIGDALLEARSITYLSIVLRRQGRPAETLRLVERTIAASRRLGLDQYVAIALANRAWAELRMGDLGAARSDAETAGLTWPAEPPYAFRWLDLWPLIAVDVAEGRLGDAVPRCRMLLDPAQQPPAAAVREALETVLVVADDPRELAAAFQRALDQARQHTYL